MIGEPIPYQMKTDDIVTIVLLFCMLLATIALTMIGKPWGRKLAQLPLFNFRQNDLTVTETPGGIQPFLLIQMGLSVTLLLFDITIRMNQPLSNCLCHRVQCWLSTWHWLFFSFFSVGCFIGLFFGCLFPLLIYHSSWRHGPTPFVWKACFCSLCW